ncbi:hypothetical protein GCM10011579_003260 [Streptomyces albiflavescens]|uniref:Uncharacterized protein n=1 Tax=Streptomyces albiflavescens TaxID=1623582 RepID=A0A917XS06_9ACTN|nr:hypothetical protein [Streptomyces albiflavescens]GGN49510.1 hypothetical protein GCM10011579_003260 [Streptomyces albiflavescens]
MSEQSDPTAPTGTTSGAFSLDSSTLRRRHRRVLQQLGFCVLVLVPWTVYLAVSLPDRYEARHWPMVWVGFDVMLLASLAGAGVAVWLRRQALVPLSFVAATLLVCDAWFDISLSWGTDDVWGSVASAVLVELPLAVLLIMRARRVLKMSIRLAWQRLGLAGEPPPLHRMPLFFALASSHSNEAVPNVAEDV